MKGVEQFGQLGSTGYEREGYANKIDFFAVFDPITEDCYLVDVEVANSNTMTLRYDNAEKKISAKQLDYGVHSRFSTRTATTG